MLFRILFLFLLSFGTISAENPFEITRELPAAYQGRFRPLESTSRLWLNEFYHRQSLKQSDLSAFDTKSSSALELLWRFHFLGHGPWDKAPFFWIHYAKLKSILGLKTSLDRFSYNELFEAINNNKETNLAFVNPLITHEFLRLYRSNSNRSKSKKFELENLHSGLWVALNDHSLVIVSAPSTPPWQFLSPKTIVSYDLFSEAEKNDNIIADEIIKLLSVMRTYLGYTIDPPIEVELALYFSKLQSSGTNPSEIFEELERRYPLSMRLQQAGSTLKMLPSRIANGEWVSLHALKLKSYDIKQEKLVPIHNFTPFPDELFESIRSTYLTIESEMLESKLQESSVQNFTFEMQQAYALLAHMPYKTSANKALLYPSEMQLKIESLYYKYPLIEIAIGLYSLAVLLATAAYFTRNKALMNFSLGLIGAAFLVHASILILRCYILQRPPVSNMFETVVYVPIITMIVGFFLYLKFRSKSILLASALSALFLLILLKLTNVDASMENVQAVLDSQYWLIIHVLMVVGSYGAFILSGVLAHFYLILSGMKNQKIEVLNKLSLLILYSIYIGVALLIPGTILGGVWAAESWGRFWDWDPKESWAFISACIYLLIIHAYTFSRIRKFGLAIGAIGGLMSISFTWYGVNYVLGTGLHSYGFGSGGEMYYYVYLLAEILVISYFCQKHIRT